MSLLHQLKRKIQKIKINLIRKNKNKELKKFVKKSRSHFSQYHTTSFYNYENFGRNFFKEFKEKKINGKNKSFNIEKGRPTTSLESTHNILISIKENYFNKTISWVGIGFEKESLIIEVMQNNKYNDKKYFNDFRRTTKTQTLNYLLQTTEKHAKKLGFKQIKIRKPQTLYWFEDPSIKDTNLNQKQIKQNIKILYNRIAKKEGYKEEKFYYTKKL